MREYTWQELSELEILECSKCGNKIKTNPKEIKLPKGWRRKDIKEIPNPISILFCEKCD